MVMRLLALRGSNLTSLGEPFSLDFTREPLAGAGLFAITGPTGSGKSTLLDAVCLALYDQMPRLADTSRRATATGPAADRLNKVGGRLPAHDVRQILRHGATEAFAEVDFADSAGTAYRARWQVRRARLRIAGRLQAQELVFTRLDTGKALGGTKTETLAAIRERVGLDFDQFRRSVLLAQGDFDAFLRAQPKDRASLLELITGTEIYGRLSRAAHERAKAEETELKLLERRLGDIRSLSPDDRASLEAERADADRTIEALTARHMLLKSDADWYRREAELAAAVEAAAAELDRAQTAEHAGEPDRQRLQRVRLALPLRPLLLAVARGTERITGLAGEVSAGETGLAAAQTARHDKRGAREDADQGLAAAEATLEATRPILATAAELDERTRAEAASLAEAEAAVTAATETLARARAARDDAAAEFDRVQQSFDAADCWIEAHAADRALAADAERVCQDIDTLAQHRLAAAETAKRVHVLNAQTEALAAALSDDRAVEAALGRDLADQRKVHDSLRQAQAATDLQALLKRRDLLTHLRLALDRASRAAADMTTRTQRLTQIDQDATDARQAVALSAQALERLEREASELEHERSVTDLAAATGSERAAHLRAVLIAGQPCPVCGATDHPFDQPGPPLEAVPDTVADDATNLHRKLRDVSGLIDEERRRSLVSQATVDGYTDRHADLSADLERARSDWADAVDAVADQATEAGISIAIRPEPADANELQTAQGLVEAEHAQVAATINHAGDVSTALERSAAELARLDHAHAAKRESVADAAEQRHRMETELASLDAAQREAAAAEGRETARLQSVLTSLDDWSAMVPDDAEGLKRRCAAIAAAWQAKSAERQASAEALPRLSTDVGVANAAVLHAEAELERHRSTAGERAARLAELKAQRDGLLGGRPTDLVRKELDQALAAARRTLQAARDAEADSTAAEARLSASLEERRRQLSIAEADLARATEDRDRRLSDVGFSTTDAEDMIALGETWAEATESRLRTLADDAMRAATVLSERRQVLAGHRSHHPTHPYEGLDASIAAAAGDLAEGRERAAAIASRLAQDDDRRRLQAAAETEIAGRRRDAERWLAVDDLIGSADGSTFRKFAQSLTLERLLALANRHLERLAPRYRLQRVPDADMDVQVVDQDMGDDVRSVGSLSGGETFLASLALALALADMSSGDALADCLFIDEGFGSLDADSLEIAISALEALQATGRRVGIISHVEAIVERIAVQVRLSRVGPGKSTISVVRT